MGGVTINVEIKDEAVRQLFADIQGRLRDLSPALKIIGEIVRTSIAENFLAGGRPTAWKPSIRSSMSGGNTLIDTKILMNSLTVKPIDNDTVAVGTTVDYAAIHQFGGTISAINAKYLKFMRGGKGTPWASKQSVTIPARPFMMIQDRDWQTMAAAIRKYILTS
jgi:phage gpG-like protein